MGMGKDSSRNDNDEAPVRPKRKPEPSDDKYQSRNMMSPMTNDKAIDAALDDMLKMQVINPFSKDNFNLTDQGKMVKDNPERARKMILLSGKKLSDYGL